MAKYSTLLVYQAPCNICLFFQAENIAERDPTLVNSNSLYKTLWPN